MSACPECLFRTELLAALSGRLEHRGRDPERLIGLLELGDEQLEAALGAERGGRPGADQALAEPTAGIAGEVQRICRHDPNYPSGLAQMAGAPSVLHTIGGLGRLTNLLTQPTAAIVGTRLASDYGLEVARGLARGLAASGITVVSGLSEGIPAAAHSGALEVNGPTVSLMPGGVDVCYPAARRVLYRRVREMGCALAELPCGSPVRSWCHTARSRIVVALARIVIVVEARERPGELLHARLANASGIPVGAVPGRLTSPVSRGAHQLLHEGAHLVRGSQDVLDLLFGVGKRQARPMHPPMNLEAPLCAVLQWVGAGHDTFVKLAALGKVDRQELALALAELELRGAVVRGDGGRYLPSIGYAARQQ